MSRRSILLLALAGVGGLLLIIAADRFDLPVLIGPGLLLFAAGVGAAGLDAITRRHTVERNQATHRTTTFVGAAAVLIGVALIVFALGFAVAGAGYLLGAEDRLIALLRERPGSALLALGCVSAAGGGARVLGARDWRGSAGRFLASIPERFGALLLLMAGVALLAAGALEVVSPAAFDRLVDPLIAPFRD